jgi:amino acid transporter
MSSTEHRVDASRDGPRRRLALVPLVAATYFMVSGGPYGLEELYAAAGFSRSILALLLTPLVWSFPVALMVGELAAALREDGGFYVWVRRAMGPFWGFQEAWLSLTASIFDMAIYPTLFVSYLSRLMPAVASGWRAVATGALMIALCAAWNLRGARSVGRSAVVMTVVLLAPFAALCVAMLVHGQGALAPRVTATAPPLAVPGFTAGIFIAMWNYMGWDNASTVAGEVERPQRTYPLAMIAAVLMVALTYAIPTAALARTGVDPTGWLNGAWVSVATAYGHHALALAIVCGGIVCGVGMFNALVMSYARLPLALARDGFLPAVLARRDPRTDAPWVAILVCAGVYVACLGLGFQRLVELDVLLYGSSLVLEFVALVVLRVREPGLARPFRVPGGLVGAVAIGLPPTVLLVAALATTTAGRVGPVSTIQFGLVIMAVGPLVYLIRVARGRSPTSSCHTG